MIRRRFLIFPLPARNLFDFVTFSTSAHALTFLKRDTASLVFWRDSFLSSTTCNKLYKLKLREKDVREYPLSNKHQPSYSDALTTHQGDLRYFLNLMTLRHDQCRHPGSGNGGAHSVSFLIGVDSMMPSPPRFGGREHPTTSAHVTICGLSRSMSTTTFNARNTCNRATRSPRGRRCLMARFAAYLKTKRKQRNTNNISWCAAASI